MVASIATLRAMKKKRVLVIAVCLFSLLLMVRKQRLVADIHFPDNAVLLLSSMATAKNPEVNETESSKSSPGDDRPFLVLLLGPKKVKEIFVIVVVVVIIIITISSSHVYPIVHR